MLFGLFGSMREREAVARLYLAVVEQARRPVFYAELGVPDTAVGRFEMTALHVWLVLRRFHTDDRAERRFAQTLFDHMFDDLDLNLREMGVGDLSIGKKVKALAKGLYGRIGSYDAGLDSADGGEALAAALRRNLFGMAADLSDVQVDAVMRYVREADARLATQEGATIRSGVVAWPAVPAAVPEPQATVSEMTEDAR